MHDGADVQSQLKFLCSLYIRVLRKKDFRYSNGLLEKPKCRNVYLINFGHQAQCNASRYFLFFDSIGDLELQQSQDSSKRRRSIMCRPMCVW